MSDRICILSEKILTVQEKDFLTTQTSLSGYASLDFMSLEDKENLPQDLQKAKVILTMGAESLYYLLGIKQLKKNRGKSLFSDKYRCKVVPTFSIYADIPETSEMRLLLSDIDLAISLAKKQKVTHQYQIVDGTDREGFDRLIHKLKTLDLYAFDIEVDEQSNWDVEQAKILGIGFSWKVQTGVYIVLREQETPLPPEEYAYRIAELKALLEDPFAEKIAHSCGYELGRLSKICGIECKNIKWDTLLMHALIDENSRHGLDALSSVYAPDLAGYKNESEVFLPAGGGSFTVIPTYILARRCAADCDLTLRLQKVLRPQLKEQGLMPVYSQIIMPHRVILTQAELRGTLINREDLDRISPIVLERRSRVLEEIKQFVKDPNFNPASPKQVGEKLLELIPSKDLENLELTDKGALGTSIGNLRILKAKKHIFPTLLISFRQLSKLHSTYIEGIRKRLHPGNILRTSYNVAGTVTGRISASNPNLQNLPTNYKIAEEYQLPSDISIHNLFMPRPGYKFIVSDGSQMELRILATMSKDPLLVKTYKEGGDVHLVTALAIIPGAKEIRKNLDANPEDEVLLNKWATIRTTAKRVNFGIAYGIGANALASELGITFSEAQGFLDGFMLQYGGVRKWIQETIGFVKRTGYSLSLFGRRRRLVDINSPIQWRQEAAARQCQNSPIQGTAADCTAIANIRIMEEAKAQKLDMHFLLNVHDELVHEVNINCIEEATDLIRKAWLKPIPRIIVPLDVTISVGDQWEH